MKIVKQGGFTPVSIILESEFEVVLLYAVVGGMSNDEYAEKLEYAFDNDSKLLPKYRQSFPKSELQNHKLISKFSADIWKLLRTEAEGE